MSKLLMKILFIALVPLASCASQPITSSYDSPGFFMGLVHGSCIGFSLIGQIFSDVRIYSFPNSGGWYDFGYVIGASAFLKSSS